MMSSLVLFCCLLISLLHGQTSLEGYSCIHINSITGINPTPSSSFRITITFDNDNSAPVLTGTYSGSNINNINDEYCKTYDTNSITLTTQTPFKASNIQLRFLGAYVYADFTDISPYFVNYNVPVNGDRSGNINFDLYHKFSYVIHIRYNIYNISNILVDGYHQ